MNQFWSKSYLDFALFDFSSVATRKYWSTKFLHPIIPLFWTVMVSMMTGLNCITTVSSVNLQGYGLSDDSLDRFKFVFPNYTMTPRSASACIRSGSEYHYPCGPLGNSCDSEYHLEIFCRHISTGYELEKSFSFNDGSWSSGHGGIGFGDGDDATQITTSAKSVMMRKTFFCSGYIRYHQSHSEHWLRWWFCRVSEWNGNSPRQHRCRRRSSGLRCSRCQFAWSQHVWWRKSGFIFIDNDHLKMALVQGINVLAVEVHNASATSNDLSSIPFLSFWNAYTPDLHFLPLQHGSLLRLMNTSMPILNWAAAENLWFCLLPEALLLTARHSRRWHLTILMVVRMMEVQAGVLIHLHGNKQWQFQLLFRIRDSAGIFSCSRILY